MQYSQTRYLDSISPGISDTALAMNAALVPPTRTQGVLTVGRVQSNTEDVYFTSVAGNVITIGLRGLSQTALTLTSVVGNQKVHANNESLEMTTHHMYDVNKVRIDENETISGVKTFSGNGNIFSGNNNSFTGTGNGFTSAVKTPGLLDVNGNETIDTPATSSAVNQLSVQNSTTGNNVIVTAAGGDTNINVEYQGKGTGRPVLQDGALMKTSAAPTVDAGVVNKKYVDDLVVTTQRLLWPITDVLGDTFSSGDISSNLNLAYRLPTDGRWYKLTNNTAFQYYDLGLVLESGNAGDTGKRILREGLYTGKNFASINPTFSSALTGTNNNVGDSTANSAISFLVDNTIGAECVVTGGTISARQQGTPAGSMLIYLILNSVDQNSYPAAFKDTSANVVRGAIIGSATIAQALFSGTYQNLSFSFGANVRIPAGHRAHLVIAKTGAASGANYYQVQSNAQTATLESSTQTWSNTENAGNLTLTVTSTSSIGYSVKAYNGTNGGYDVAPSFGNQWNRPIGKVITQGVGTSSFYFQPDGGKNSSNIYGGAINSGGGDLGTITTRFCPTKVNVFVTARNEATTPLAAYNLGWIASNSVNASSNVFSSVGNNSPQETYNFLGCDYIGNSENTLFINTTQAGTLSNPKKSNQNRLNCVRLEDGFYIYTSYPAGTGFVSGGQAGFTLLSYNALLNSVA